MNEPQIIDIAALFEELRPGVREDDITVLKDHIREGEADAAFNLFWWSLSLTGHTLDARQYAALRDVGLRINAEDVAGLEKSYPLGHL